MRYVFLTFVCLVIAGCATPAPPPAPYHMTTPFSDDDFQAWAGTGPASLYGRAFLKTVGGDVKTCAGNLVALLPDNAYDEELTRGAISGSGSIDNEDSRVRTYFRSAVCDAQGNFALSGLAAGRWIVATAVTWDVPNAQTGEIDQQGGSMRKAISLESGVNHVLLTHADRTHPQTPSANP